MTIQDFQEKLLLEVGRDWTVEVGRAQTFGAYRAFPLVYPVTAISPNNLAVRLVILPDLLQVASAPRTIASTVKDAIHRREP